MNLSNRSKYDIGFTGFGDLALSVFTVYQAASQVHIQYVLQGVPKNTRLGRRLGDF